MSKASLRLIPSSYRDPAGFVVYDSGVFKRVVTSRGLKDYREFIKSGLYEDLVSCDLLISHYEEPLANSALGELLLVPEQIPFISYPFEWSFDELRDAALVTLKIQQRALARGFMLKDASAYNVQFLASRPVFIDTLSFTRYEGGPWPAYEQFCRHFLGPLFLMRYRSPDAARFLKVELDGFRLERVSRSLPLRSWLNGGALLHIHLHARALRHKPQAGGEPLGSNAHLPQLIASLRRTIENMPRPAAEAHWTGYYSEWRFYSPAARESKRELVQELVYRVKPNLVYDLGANTGLFTREAAAAGALCIAFDKDADCVNRLYLEERSKSDSLILPLVMDLENPSPPLGFGLNSTMSLLERPQADLVMCLGLLHHLRVSGNLPMVRIAHFLARLGRKLLIEFIPPSDPAIMTLSRRSDFDDFNVAGFLKAFSSRFRLEATRPLACSQRVLYLFERLPCSA